LVFSMLALANTSSCTSKIFAPTSLMHVWPDGYGVAGASGSLGAGLLSGSLAAAPSFGSFCASKTAPTAGFAFFLGLSNTSSPPSSSSIANDSALRSLLFFFRFFSTGAALAAASSADAALGSSPASRSCRRRANSSLLTRPTVCCASCVDASNEDENFSPVSLSRYAADSSLSACFAFSVSPNMRSRSLPSANARPASAAFPT